MTDSEQNAYNKIFVKCSREMFSIVSSNVPEYGYPKLEAFSDCMKKITNDLSDSEVVEILSLLSEKRSEAYLDGVLDFLKIFYKVKLDIA